MRTSHRILKNIFSLSAAHIAKQGIALIYTIYLARILSPDGFGVIGFAQNYVIYFILVVNLGLDVLGVRQISKHPETRSKYVNAILSFKTTIGVVCYIILAGTVLAIPELYEIKFILLVAGLQIFVNSFQLQWVFEGMEKMEVLAIRQVLLSLINLAGIFLFVKGPDDTLIAILIITGGLLLNTLLTLFYYLVKYGKFKYEFDPKFWWELAKTSIPIGMLFFIVMIYNSLDTVMLKFMQSYHDTGIYHAAHKVLVVMVVPSTILQGAFFPNFARNQNYKEPGELFKKFSLIIVLAGSFLASSMFVFAHDAVSVLGGEYEATGYLVQIIMLNVLFAYIGLSFSTALIAWHREKKVLIAIIVAGITNLVLNFLLIPKYSYYGALVATVSSEFVVMIINWFIFFRLTGKHYIGQVLKSVIISVVSCIPSYFMHQNGVNIVLSIFTCIILFIGINFVFKTITLAELKYYLKKA